MLNHNKNVSWTLKIRALKKRGIFKDFKLRVERLSRLLVWLDSKDVGPSLNTGGSINLRLSTVSLRQGLSPFTLLYITIHFPCSFSLVQLVSLKFYLNVGENYLLKNKRSSYIHYIVKALKREYVCMCVPILWFHIWYGVCFGSREAFKKSWLSQTKLLQSADKVSSSNFHAFCGPQHLCFVSCFHHSFISKIFSRGGRWEKSILQSSSLEKDIFLLWVLLLSTRNLGKDHEFCSI